MFIIYLSFIVCKGRISHLDKFKVKPEAHEKLLMKEIAWGIKDTFFKNKVVSSANWDILSTFLKIMYFRSYLPRVPILVEGTVYIYTKR